jgi:hypothetical protein
VDAASARRAGTDRRADRPRVPSPPCPARRISCPSRTPAGKLTLTSRPSSVNRRRPPASASSSDSSRSASRSRPRRGPPARSARAPNSASNRSPPNSTRLSPEPLVSEEVLEALLRRLALRFTPTSAEAVVTLPLVSVGQNLVGLAELLEALLSVAVGVQVRVILARQLAVRAPDRILVRVARDAQHLVIVRVAQRHLSSNPPSNGPPL